MRIILLNVINAKHNVHTRYYPLAFGYLTSYSRNFGEEFEPIYAEAISESMLKKLQPDVVAMTTVSENFNLARFYAYLIKKYDPKIKVVIGGVHISAVPFSLSRFMDIGIIGEGEETFLELLKNEFEPCRRIDGIVYKDNNGFVKTEKRKLIEPLDSIPHPDRSIFPKDRAYYLFTSRGCPYRCIFCFSSRFWGKVRFHSPKYVAEEIEILKDRFGCSHINVFDDTFVLDMERVKQIADLVKDFKVTFSVQARVNLVTAKLVKTLKNMNVTDIALGFESNSQRILTYLNKGTTVKDNVNAVRIIRHHKLRLNGSFIRNIPGETKEDLKATYKFIHDFQIPYTMYRLMRYPGTPIYNGSTDWDSLKVYRYPPKRPIPLLRHLAWNILKRTAWGRKSLRAGLLCVVSKKFKRY